MSTALTVGAILALLCLAYVVYPLVRSADAGVARARGATASAKRAAAPAPVTDEEIEAVISAYRATHVVGDRCPTCGPRPETDAVFCSNCGRRLTNPA